MIFSSPIFMFLFVPILVFFYFVFPDKFKIPILLLFSFLFYVWGQGLLVLAIISLLIVNYLLSWSMKFCKKTSLVIGIVFNVGLLIAFKYSNFLIDNLNMMGLQIDNVTWIAPLGISFVVFMAISYLVDVYRGTVIFSNNPMNLAFHFFFFPKIISGPLDRYNGIVMQMSDRKVKIDRIASGIRKFVVGLGKKMLIANALGVVVDQIFSIPVESLPVATAWLGAICFTLQIYFDFSGYTDMAIGIGRIFGFELLENFNYPYISKSIREFWKRWHITLSRWLKDYFYIPLGGNRTAFTAINLLVVFLVCGIWHGPSWTFVIWGLWHGVFLILERTKWFNLRLLGFVRYGYTLLVIVIGWVFFRSSSIEYAFGYLKSMFGFGFGDAVYDVFTYINTLLIVVLIAAIIGSLPVVPWLSLLRDKLSKRWSNVYSIAMIAILLGIFILSIAEIAIGFYKPFLYGQF